MRGLRRGRGGCRLSLMLVMGILGVTCIIIIMMMVMMMMRGEFHRDRLPWDISTTESMWTMPKGTWTDYDFMICDERHDMTIFV